MPLLYKKDFVQNPFPPGLSDSDEVFYCEVTNEVFTDYEEFCERIYLCNSLVWSCSISGRSNLTYLEASECEENARKQLAEFPLTLRIPVFYLITLSNRKSLSELAEDIFVFARDRYFVGETVEVFFSNETWCDCHIIQVTYPTNKVIQEYQASHPNNNNHNNNAARDYWPPSSLYSYEVEIVNNKDGLTYFVRGDQVRRRKGLFTRDKNKLFIKQFVHLDDGVWKLRDDVFEKYCIHRVKFDEIFAGDPLNLVLKKKTSAKDLANNKQVKKEKKQETIQKYFKQKSSPSSVSTTPNKSNNSNNKKITPQKKPPAAVQQKTLIQKLKNKYKGVQNGQNKKSTLINKINNKKNDLKDKIKQNKKKNHEINKSLTKDELLKIAFQCKDKDNHGVRSVGDHLKLNKETRQQLAELIKELNKRREDLECEDLKDLPEPTAVQLRVPNECFGDFVMILEFFHSFGRIVNMKDYFPFGVNIELVERALMENEVAGPLNDLVQLLLTAIFDLQDQHAEDMVESNISGVDGVEGSSEFDKLISLSNAAAAYSEHFQGTPLSQLTLDCATLSEILRLHFLSSGRVRSVDDPACDRNSFNIDEPGRNLCLKNPELIKLLSQRCLFELSVEQKIEVLICLINQILMFTSLREKIDERGDKIRANRADLRNQQAAEIRKRKEALLKAKEQVENGIITVEQKEALKDSRSRKDAELARKARDISDAEMEFQVLPLGVDRAYRRFWLFSSLPGLFVEEDEMFPGTCLPKGTPYAEDAEACLKYIRKLFEDGGPSNKENLVGGNKDHLNLSTIISTGSPCKKMLVEKNGGPPMDTIPQSSSNKTTPSRSNSKLETKNACKPLTCWGDPITCPIHGVRLDNRQRVVWSFYKSENDLNNLIDSLNGRGYRESKLKKTLVEEKQRIVDSLTKCPLSKLDPTYVSNEQNEVRKSSRMGPKYDNPNLDFPRGTPVNDVLAFNLRDMILEMEEKIYGGLLGNLKVEDRDEWRKSLKENNYDKYCDVLKWGPGSSCSTKTNAAVSGSGEAVDELVDKIKQEDISDDSNAVNPKCETLTSLAGIDGLIKLEKNDVERSAVVFNMACAILQLLQAVDPRYLMKPFGDDVDTAQQDTSSSTSSPTSVTSQQNDDQNQSKKRKSKISLRERWEESLMTCNSISQLFIHFYTLENSIEWSKSALKTYSCKVCKQRDPEKMLLCDMCNKGYHMYCLKPKLTRVPEGDWFCPNCQLKHDKDKSKKEKRRDPNKKQDDENEKNELEGVIGKCKVCKTKGEVAVCDDCNSGFHLDCVTPPLRKFPRFTWTCPNCRHQSAINATQSTTNKKSAKDKYDKNDNDYSDAESDDGDDGVASDSDDDSNDVERCPSRRRCAKTATAKISRFAKQLRTNSWNGEDEENKNNESGTSSRRRSRRSIEATSDVTTTSSKDLPLDNAALQEILDIVMHHKDAWPFLRPVTKSEVPDYRTIIKNPMDFGTVKHKLNMLEYNKNSQVIADAMLVFENCYTYNQADTEVYKAGERLQKVFEKLCTERKMKIYRKNGDNNNDEEEVEDEMRPPNSKKPRTVF